MGWDDAHEMKILAGRNHVDLSKRICDHLNMPLGRARTAVFPDGELIVHVEENVRGRDCFVIISTCDPVNDNLMELLVFADSLRRASARRITAVVPYFGYGRQDRKERGREPITAKLVANLITAAGYDRVLTLDLHAAQIQGFFDIPVDHLSSGAIFLRYFRSIRDELGELAVVSPDVGNLKVAEAYAQMLGGELAVIYKKRITGDMVESDTIMGDVKGKTVLMMDDMISTAGTSCEAAALLEREGAKRIIVAATHPVLVGKAIERLQASPITDVIVTNTIPPGNNKYKPLQDRLKVLCVGKLFADAIDHIHNNKSVSSLFREFAESKR